MVTSMRAFVVHHLVQGNLYSPPFNKSSVSYPRPSTCGTRAHLTVTREDRATFVAGALPSAPANGNFRVPISADGTVV